MKRKILFLLVIFELLMTSCSKEEPNNQPMTEGFTVIEWKWENIQ